MKHGDPRINPVYEGFNGQQPHWAMPKPPYPEQIPDSWYPLSGQLNKQNPFNQPQPAPHGIRASSFILSRIRSLLQPNILNEGSLLKATYDFLPLQITYPFTIENHALVKLEILEYIRHYGWTDVEIDYDLVHVPNWSKAQNFPTVENLTGIPNSALVKSITLIADQAPKPSEEKTKPLEEDVTSDSNVRKIKILVQEGKTIYVNAEEKNLSSIFKVLTSLQDGKVIEDFFYSGKPLTTKDTEK